MDEAALRLADMESRRICRFCLRICSANDNGGLTDIGSNSTVVSQIEFALTLQVAPQDGLPQRICDGCEWLLEKFHKFKDQCVRAEMVLKKFAESGVPLMRYFEPVDFEEFRWKRKAWDGVDVEVQTDVEVKPEPMYELMAPETIKQEVEQEEGEEWSYAEEPALELNVDHSDQVTMDEITRKLYLLEDASNSISEQGTELITEMDIGSPHCAEPNQIEMFDDISDASNDTVEFNPVQQPSVPTEDHKPVESYPNSSQEMLLLMEDDGARSQDAQQNNEQISPQSPSDVIYEGLPTMPLSESDGLSSRFVNMEPGEIVSDDEYADTSVVIISSDNEDSPEKSKPIEIAKPAAVEDDYRCGKCDRSFPQSQLLEAHQRAYHSRNKPATTKTPSALQHKMAIMIDNPTKRCPKCAAMVHKASYWAHIKSHSAGERALVNYDKNQEPVAEAASNNVLEDDLLWDAAV